MRWNWQLPDWPEFRFDAERIRASEEQFLKGSGVIIGALHHLDADERNGLTIELISQEVVDSSAIEGEVLDRASVQSSLARHLGFAADQRCASAAEAGAAELMADVYPNYAAPLDDRTGGAGPAGARTRQRIVKRPLSPRLCRGNNAPDALRCRSRIGVNPIPSFRVLLPSSAQG
jgi:hypothetical protein